MRGGWCGIRCGRTACYRERRFRELLKGRFERFSKTSTDSFCGRVLAANRRTRPAARIWAISSCAWADAGAGSRFFALVTVALCGWRWGQVRAAGVNKRSPIRRATRSGRALTKKCRDYFAGTPLEWVFEITKGVVISEYAEFASSVTKRVIVCASIHMSTSREAPCSRRDQRSLGPGPKALTPLDLTHRWPIGTASHG